MHSVISLEYGKPTVFDNCSSEKRSLSRKNFSKFSKSYNKNKQNIISENFFNFDLNLKYNLFIQGPMRKISKQNNIRFFRKYAQKKAQAERVSLGQPDFMRGKCPDRHVAKFCK
jgi:hypothetical protein